MMPKNGTVLDLTKWMRGLAESLGTKRRVNIPTLTVRSWLDLCKALEDAARRDNKAARDAIYREAEANARKAVGGNAAKMRAALEEILKLDDTLVGRDLRGNKDALNLLDAITKANHALSEPARNCDVCPTDPGEAAKVFHSQVGYHGYCYETHEWLLAPATPKGGAP